MKNLHADWDNLEPNQKRTLRQQQIHESWITAKGRGYVLAQTGFGKSELGRKAIARCLEGGADRVINIVVPSTMIREQWELMVTQNGWTTVFVYVSASYLNLPKEKRICGLLVVDECHRYTRDDSEVFSKIIDSTKRNWIYCLSATMTKEQREFLDKRGVKLIGEVDIKEANRESYVAKNDIYALSIGMNGDDEVTYQEMTDSFNYYASIFGYDFNEAKRLMGRDAKAERDAMDEAKDWAPGATFGFAKAYFSKMAERKTFLQTPTSKIDAIEELCNIFRKKKIITFSEHTSYVSKINDRLGPRAVEFHSSIATKYYNPDGKQVIMDAKQYKLQRALKRKYTRIGAAKLKESNLKEFNESTNMIMNTAKAVDEGADIYGVDMAIIVSYSSTERQLRQRIGRAIRYFEGKHAVIVVLYIKSSRYKTQELKWLKTASKGLQLIWVDDIQSIVEDLTNKGYPPE